MLFLIFFVSIMFSIEIFNAPTLYLFLFIVNFFLLFLCYVGFISQKLFFLFSLNEKKIRAKTNFQWSS